MARHFWTDGDAVGRLVRRREDDDPPWLVVGVAADAKAKVRTLGEAPRNMVYLPYSQRSTRSLTVVARTSTDPERTALVVRQLVAGGLKLTGLADRATVHGFRSAFRTWASERTSVPHAALFAAYLPARRASRVHPVATPPPSAPPARTVREAPRADGHVGGVRDRQRREGRAAARVEPDGSTVAARLSVRAK